MRVNTSLLLAAALVASPVSVVAKNEAAHTSSPPYAISNNSSVATQLSSKSSSKSTTSSLIPSSLSSSISSTSSVQTSSLSTSSTTLSTTSSIPSISTPTSSSSQITLPNLSSTSQSTTSDPISSSTISSSTVSSSTISSSSQITSPNLSSTSQSTTSDPISSSTISSSTVSSSTISSSTPSSDPISNDPSSSHSTSSHTTTRRHNTTSHSTTSHQSTSTPVLLPNSTSITGFNTTTRTNQNSTHTITQTASQPSPPPNLPPGYTFTKLPCNATASRNATQHGRSGCRSGSVISIVPDCTPLPSSKTFTHYVVVHTSTTTFLGNRTDYTPPYAPMETPKYCDPNVFPAVPRPLTPGKTQGGLMSLVPMVTETFTIEGQALTAEFPVEPKTQVQHVPVTTYITTDKNPAVVFPSDPIPKYGKTWTGGASIIYHTPVPGDDGAGPAPVTNGPTYTITAWPTSVVINSQTYTVAPGASSRVTVRDGGVFNINPTAVVGQGVSVTRPPSVMGPSSSVLDGIPVTSVGPNLEIGGGTFAIPTSSPNTVHVNGKAVTINPTGVTIGPDSMGFMRPAASDVIVAGGEMLTAIGRSVVVLHSITYTYGNGIAPVVQVINGDTIAIEPTGVVVHGSTLGGPSAQPTDTEFEIVGAATIARIPPSMVIVNGETYAVGPGANTRTVVIGDQTLTMGPIGVVMATTTLRYPFDASATTTAAGRTGGESMPQETGNGKEEEDAAYSLRPDVRVGLTCLCIVFGVLVLG